MKEVGLSQEILTVFAQVVARAIPSWSERDGEQVLICCKEGISVLQPLCVLGQPAQAGGEGKCVQLL